MTFLSIEWLLWMWLTVGLYWAFPRRWRGQVLMALSLAFLLPVSPLSAVLLVAFLLVTHAVGNLRQPDVWLVSVVAVGMLGCLMAFKTAQTVDPATMIETVLIPLGLSYYTFRCLHFLIERLKGGIACARLDDLARYLLFLPTFVVGPIHRFDTFEIDTRRQRFDTRALSLGFERILQGYVQIIIISNYVTEFLLGNFIESIENQDGILVLYLKIVQNGLNL